MCPSEPPIIGGYSRTSTPCYQDFAVPPLLLFRRPEPPLPLRGGRIMGGKNRFGKGQIEIISCSSRASRQGKAFRVCNEPKTGRTKGKRTQETLLNSVPVKGTGSRPYSLHPCRPSFSSDHACIVSRASTTPVYGRMHI